MMTNFQQNISLPTSGEDFRLDFGVRRSPWRPTSPNLLDSCCKELERKGLKFFDNYKYADAAIYNKTHMPRSPPTQCRGFFTHTRHHNSELTTSAEMHEYYLKPKPDFSRHTYVNISREQIDLHCNKKDDGEANDNCRATMDGSVSEGDNQVAKSDSRQQEMPPLPSVQDEIQYEDALSIYEVYTL